MHMYVSIKPAFCPKAPSTLQRWYDSYDSSFSGFYFVISSLLSSNRRLDKNGTLTNAGSSVDAKNSLVVRRCRA